jgi:hypothetical protein
VPFKKFHLTIILFHIASFILLYFDFIIYKKTNTIMDISPYSSYDICIVCNNDEKLASLIVNALRDHVKNIFLIVKSYDMVSN